MEPKEIIAPGSMASRRKFMLTIGVSIGLGEAILLAWTLWKVPSNRRPRGSVDSADEPSCFSLQIVEQDEMQFGDWIKLQPVPQSSLARHWNRERLCRFYGPDIIAKVACVILAGDIVTSRPWNEAPAGLRYGGTYDGDAIYLSTYTLDHGGTMCDLDAVFHHELSSLLLPLGFPREDWLEVCPKFKYLGTSTASALMKQLDAVRMAPKELLEVGVLSKYAAVSIEEDINVYAEWMFTDPDTWGFWRLYDQYEMIRAKAQILVRFYRRLGFPWTIDGLRNRSSCRP